MGRDSRGEVRFCAINQKRDVQSPLQAELLAVLFGIEIAKDHNFQALYLEMDSKFAATEILKGSATLCTWDASSLIFAVCLRSLRVTLLNLYQED